MSLCGENGYLDLVQDILDNGVQKTDRTGTGTLSKFGAQMRFDLSNNSLPLLTTKKVFFRGIAEELFWIIAGDTNANHLSEKGVRFWDDNATREFLDKQGLTENKQGDLGKVYGFQWRHFGAEYKTCNDDYTGQGVDQLANAIDLIKNKPESRRIIINAWNPADLDKMSLPPCHFACQFYVADGKLSCQLYQRSGDIGLGVPFNIASYSLLTIMVAHVCGLQPGEFIHTIGDAHIYLNHIDAMKEQLTREPNEFPTLTINRQVSDIEDFKFEDFVLDNYQCHGKIKMKMAV